MSARLGGAGVRVLLVGTGTHVADSRLPPVPAVAGTIAALRDTLITICGVRPEVITTLVDPAGPEQFLDAVIDTAEAATDVLLVYYVGHGLPSASGDLHLATHATADITRKAAYQALPFAELSGVLTTAAAGLVVLVLDCCYSGRADNPVPSGALLASADRDEQALAPAGEPYTAFSGSLLEALRDGIPTAPLDLRLHHVFDHVHRAMRDRGRDTLPLLRLGNRAYDLVIARNAAYRGNPAPAEPPADGSCPYRGLEPYAAEDESVFAGRSAAVDNVLRRLREAMTTGGPVLVTGPSGCGKSSVVAAGVIPAIRAGELDALRPGRPEPVLFTPGDDPIAAAARVDWSDPGRIVIVDQFEELFIAAVPDADRREFVTALATAATPVIVCVRSDFDGHCAQYPELAAALEERHVVVGPMTTGELRAAIVEPAALNGFVLQAGLVEVLLRDVGAEPDLADAADYNPGVLPLLSHALLRTWQLRSGRTLTVDGYRAAGGVSGAVAASAEDVFGRLAAAEQDAARAMLLRMVRISPDGPDTRRRIPRSVVADTPALAAFADARLITLDQDTAELTHEALIRSWPRLSGWINMDRSGRQEAQELAEAAGAWLRASRDPALLYRGGRLAASRARIGAPAEAELGAEVRDFLAASTRHEQRQIRVRRGFLAALMVLVVAASGAAWVAASRGDLLSRQLATATAENLATASEAQVLDRPAFSARAAVAAWRSDPSDPAARTALALRYQNMRSVDRVFPDLIGELITDLAASTDGGTALLEHEHGLTVVTGLLTSGTPSTWEVPGVVTPSGRLSPDGRWLAAFDTGNDLSLWDLRAHTGPVRLLDTAAKGESLHVTFSADSAKIVAVHQGIRAWRTADRAPIPVAAAVSGGRPVQHAWFTDRDDRLLVQYGADDSVTTTLETRAVTDGRLLESFPAGSQPAGNGQRVVTCSVDDGAPPPAVREAATGRTVGALPADAGCDAASTGDTGYVVNPPRLVPKSTTVRVTPVAGGVSHDFVLPAVRQDSPVSHEPDTSIWVVQPAGTSPSVLMYTGNAVLRLTALAPDWTTTMNTTAGADGNAVMLRTDNGLESVDRSTGERLGHVKDGAAAEGSEFSYFDIGVPGVIARTGRQWRITRFVPPRLTTRETITVTAPTTGNHMVAVGDDKYLVVAAGDQLSAWDFPSGHLVAGPFDLARTAGRRDHFRSGVDLSADPSRRTVVAVSAPDEPIQLWDLGTGRLTSTVRDTGRPVFDQTGDRLALLRPGHTVTIWNVAKNVAEGRPFSVPNALNLLGFTTDGYLLVDTGEVIELWDTGRHVVSGELAFGSSSELTSSLNTDTGRLRVEGTGVMPSELPLVAADWYGRLCAAFPGGFTRAEKELLPVGADQADPCR